MNKYEFLKSQLEEVGEGKMKSFGNSMTPILKSGSLLTFKKQDDYEIGDIVFCKVRGRYIDAHKIIKKDESRGYLIANNHGWENGWTKRIFGRAIKSEINDTIKDL
jgi:SOS-response transcriptional repressor LexA